MEHIVLLHGAIGCKEQLADLSARLQSNYLIHTLNFSGHGGEPFNGEVFSIPAFAEELFQFIGENKIEKPHLFGYSMGGYVAMYLSRHYPGMVDKIITLATKYHWDEPTAAKEARMLHAEPIQQKVPAFAQQLEERHHPNDWKEVLAKTREMLTRLGKKNALEPGDYKAINNPALLLLGDKDKMITLEETLTVQHNLPNGIYSSLPDTPHPIEQVNPELLAAMVAGFIKGES